MTELTKQCLNLPKGQRERLIRILTDSLMNQRVDDGSRFRHLLLVATDICGKGILSQSRDFDLVIGRSLIAYQMRKEGFSYLTISKWMGKHHATIIHMVKRMQDVIDYEFQPELRYWEEFQKRII